MLFLVYGSRERLFGKSVSQKGFLAKPQSSQFTHLFFKTAKRECIGSMRYYLIVTITVLEKRAFAVNHRQRYFGAAMLVHLLNEISYQFW